jgi:hypothetical protein
MDDIASIITPTGIAAVAAIRISGSNSHKIIQKISNLKEQDLIPGTFKLAWIIDYKAGENAGNDENAGNGVVQPSQKSTAHERTSSRLRRTNDRSVLEVHEDHEDDENAEIEDCEPSYDVMYSCGPKPMLKALQSKISPDKLAYMSLEERMGCGVGACLACVCNYNEGFERDKNYSRVCTEGPVYKLHEISL